MREELSWLLSWSDHHRRLFVRLSLVLVLSLVFDLVCAALVWHFERHVRGTEIHGYGDALFFSTVQILTISSQLKNPLTTAGRLVDVVLEIWGIGVVGSIAGSFGSFFVGATKAQESAKRRPAEAA